MTVGNLGLKGRNGEQNVQSKFLEGLQMIFL